jgi:tetratricopeptide (TPR) repeat protein
MHRDVAAWIERAFGDRRDEVVELIAHHLAAAHRVGPSEELRAAAFTALAEAAENAYARSGFERSVSLARDAVELAPAGLERARALEALGYAAFVMFDGTTAWESLREAADIVNDEAPDDRARLARICGSAVMVPTRAGGLMRAQPLAEEVKPYLDLGLEAAGTEDSEALALLLCGQGFWDFGFRTGVEVGDREPGQRAAERAREIARRMGRADLELAALDAVTSGLNQRGLYGLAEPIDRARLDIARRVRDPFEVSDTFYTAAWSALEIGGYREVEELAAEFQALEMAVRPLGHLSLTALARLPLGDWDGALEAQAQLRELLGGGRHTPPSFASGGYGAEAFIHEARGDRAAADAILAQIEALGGLPRRRRSTWALPQVALTLGLRGDFEAAREALERIRDVGPSRPRRLEALCSLIAEQGTWEEAGAVIAETRSHAEVARLIALPLHADRLDGRAALARGDAEAALPLLERARDGLAGLEARWEVALTELSLGEALAALGRDAEAAETLTRAAAEFARLRVPRELERARGILGALSPA